MSVKKDCFAYNKEMDRCNALTVMQCDFKECNFYKSKKQKVKVQGRSIDCCECDEIMKK